MEMQLNKDMIATQRDKRAWSQTHLAEASGLSLRTIQRIEKTGSASLESAKALASVYEISIDRLRGDDSKGQEPIAVNFLKLSPKATKISFIFAVPIVAIALYLLWSGHDSMAWVKIVRDSIFSDTISEDRLNKISFLITIVSVGLPTLVPGFVYDLLKRQGVFSD